jgi:hypothetical protein
MLAGCLLYFLSFIRLTGADDQVETTQIAVQATVSSEPSMMQATAPPEGLIHLDVAATGHEGKPFSGLAAKDFTLLVDYPLIAHMDCIGFAATPLHSVKLRFSLPPEALMGDLAAATRA